MLACLERLRLYIQGYNLYIQYTPGACNPADYTSHRLLKNILKTHFEDYVNTISCWIISKTITKEEIIKHTVEDNLLNKLKIVVQTGSDKCWKLPELTPLKQVKYELSVTTDCMILRGFCLVMPKEQTINLADSGHDMSSRQKKSLDKVFPNVNKIIEEKLKKVYTLPHKERDSI